MSRLEVLPGESDDRDEVAGVGSTTAMDVVREGTGSTVTNEFGEVVDAVDAVDAAAPLSGESKEALSGGEEVHSQGEEDGFVAAAASASASASTEATERGAGSAMAPGSWEEDAADVATDGGLVSEATAWFLSCVDFFVSWAHFLSTVSMPWGAGGHMSCVSAIYLALFVRLAVATAFSALRVVLGLPALPPAASDRKPGMVMGMVLASVPTLGKVLALGNLMKSIFSDTNLVVAGTVLTLALNLALEEGAGPRRLVEGVSSVLGLVLPFQASEGGGSGHLKEL